jgi:hypothetical protein
MHKTEGVIEIGYGYVALLSVLLVLSFYFVLGLFRISVRKAKKLDVFGQKTAKSIFNKSKKFGLLTIYQFLVWIFTVIWFTVGMILTGEKIFLVYGIFGSLTLIAFSRALVFLALNDYNYTEDVA